MDVDPHHARFVGVDGALSWHGYVLTCEMCGSQTGWLLHVVQERGVYGTRAWAECAQGHVMAHPLIYPAFVTALGDWSRIPEGQRPSPEAAFADWRPHVEHARDFGAEICSTEPAVLRYEPWDVWLPAVRADRWPELYAAAHHA